MDEQVKDRLEEILSLLKALVPGPMDGGLHKKKGAARLLGIGLTKLEGLIRRGEVSTRTLGGRELIPHSEILRLSRPDESKRPRGGRRPVAEYDAQEEADSAREALRALRKKRA